MLSKPDRFRRPLSAQRYCSHRTPPLRSRFHRYKVPSPHSPTILRPERAVFRRYEKPRSQYPRPSASVASIKCRIRSEQIRHAFQIFLGDLRICLLHCRPDRSVFPVPVLIQPVVERLDRLCMIRKLSLLFFHDLYAAILLSHISILRLCQKLAASGIEDLSGLFLRNRILQRDRMPEFSFLRLFQRLIRADCIAAVSILRRLRDRLFQIRRIKSHFRQCCLKRPARFQFKRHFHTAISRQRFFHGFCRFFFRHPGYVGRSDLHAVQDRSVILFFYIISEKELYCPDADRRDHYDRQTQIQTAPVPPMPSPPSSPSLFRSCHVFVQTSPQRLTHQIRDHHCQYHRQYHDKHDDRYQFAKFLIIHHELPPSIRYKLKFGNYFILFEIVLQYARRKHSSHFGLRAVQMLRPNVMIWILYRIQ